MWAGLPWPLQSEFSHIWRAGLLALDLVPLSLPLKFPGSATEGLQILA